VVWQKPREIAARILLRHAGARLFVEDAVDQELGKTRLSQADRGLVQELCYGAVRWQATLDWLIERRTPARRPPASALALARLGLYQLFWLDRVPEHAAVNETVEAARTLDFASQTGFLNALLRGYTREADATRTLLTELKTSQPALGWSHPGWLVDRWQHRLGDAAVQKLLAWNNTPAQTYARINTLRTDAKKTIEVWRTEGVEYDFGRWDWVPESLVFLLRRHPPLDRLASFADGWYYIQDPSTLLAVHLLAPKPGERILDLCAAPGGKATLIAQYIDNDGRVIAAEPEERRRQRLHENCQRLGADIEVIGSEYADAMGPYDAILIDAPCSNTGVLRRRIEARWRLTPQELERSTKIQADLLRSAAPMLKPGGRIVYSTCSLEPEENRDRVDAFLAEFPKFQLEASRQLEPSRDSVDGAYAARLVAPAA
jgi:16S rRNA (cytosine967-C5)-methyltransferase